MKIVCKKCSYQFERLPGADSSGPSAEEVCPRCGAAVDVAAQIAEMAARTTHEGEHAPHGDAPVGSDISQRSLGDYEILDEISRGAMGVVYKARHKTLGRVVALKVMIAGEHASPDQVVRFEKEARAAAKLRHRNIVPIYDIGIEDGKRFFTMDFVEGTPLDALIARKKLTPRHALEIAAELGDALAYAHARGVIHRDIKPGNIMIDSSGQPQIMDFGLAKQIDSDTKFTKTGTTIGTPSYMSPEQARGENTKIDHRSDVYSLGAVMHEMLTGKPPFTGETMMNIIMKVIHDDPAPVRRSNPKLHRDIQTIVAKAMEKEPARRYPSMADLAADIRRYMAGEMITARPAGPFRRAAKTLKKYRTPVIVGLVIAALASVIFGAIIHIIVVRQEAARQRAELAQRPVPEQKPGWVVKFSDDFSKPTLGPAWGTAAKEWTVKDGRLTVQTRKRSHIQLGQAFEGAAVVEFAAWAHSPGALINCFLGRDWRTGYTFRFGNLDGNNITLRERGRLLAQVECPPIISDVRYNVRIERRGTSLIYRVAYRVNGEDKVHELRYDDPELLRALGTFKFGFDTWVSTVRFDDVKVSREEFAGERLNKLQAIDFYIFSRGQLQRALVDYRAIVEKHRGQLIAVLAEHNCGLILEALGRQKELEEALQHYRSVEKKNGLLEEKHQRLLLKNRERMFFVQINLGRYKPAADELAALSRSGQRFDAGSVWKFPAILSRCAGELAFEPALKIMENARFIGDHPSLRGQWEMTGARMRGNFLKALNEVCRGLADQGKYDELKRAFLALPDKRASASFERAVGRALGKNDAPAALDLLSFARQHDMKTPRLEQSAQALAQRFITSKQYPRVANVYTAYPSRTLVKHFNKAVSELVRADDISEAISLFSDACRHFEADKRWLQEAAGLVMSGCIKTGQFHELRRVYAMYGDTRLARRLIEAADALLKAGELKGAYDMLEYARESAPDRPRELGRIAADLAARFVAEDELEDALELAEKYPSAGMAGPLAAAVTAASAADDRSLLEKVMAQAIAGFHREKGVAAAVNAAVRDLVEAGEAERALRAYEDAAKSRGQDKDAASSILLSAGRTLLAGGAYAQAAAAYVSGAHTAPKKEKAAATALVRAGVIFGHIGETQKAERIWNELPEKHAQATAEVQIAKLMSGLISTDDFKKWHASNPRSLAGGEDRFYLALRAAGDNDNKAARELLTRLMAENKTAWFYNIAEAALQKLPEPPAEPKPGD